MISISPLLLLIPIAVLVAIVIPALLAMALAPGALTETLTASFRRLRLGRSWVVLMAG